MRFNYALSSRTKDRAGEAAVVLFLIGIFLATGCDVPGREKQTRRTASERPSAAVASIQTPTVRPASYVAEEPVAETQPARVAPEHVTFDEAEAAFREGRYEDAAVLFTVYADNRPENVWGFYMLGLSDWKAGNLAGAEASFGRALGLDPFHVKSLLNLSRVLLELERPDEALRHVEKALEFDPGSGDGFRLLGQARYELGRVEEAIEAYHQAIIIDETDAWSMNNLGLVHIRREAFDVALPPLARATELRDDVAVFQNNLGIALERSDYFTAATEAFRRVLQIDATYAKAQLNLARVEGRTDDTAQPPLDLADLARRFVVEIRGDPEEISEAVPIDAVSDTVPAIPEAHDSGMIRTQPADTIDRWPPLFPARDTTASDSARTL